MAYGRMTLLEMTQNILSAMDSDEVNSITDTVEATQVAEVIRETFYELWGTTNLPEHRATIQLTGLGDVTKPTHMNIPSDAKEIFWVKYDYYTDEATDYRDITYLDPKEFFDYLSARAGQDNTQEVVDSKGIRYYVFTDRNPTYYTTFNDRAIMFDSYNNTLDTTLQTTKSVAMAQLHIDFLLEDDYIPTIDANLFPLLLAEAKATSFINFKQISSAKEEQRARRQRVRSMNDLWRADQRRPYNRTPNYGKPR